MRFARGERISDATLREAIERARRGLIDADLGSGLIKQRIGRPGQGRSGGFRSLIAFRLGERAIFLYGFAKNERDNVDRDELTELRRLARTYLSADGAALARMLDEGAMMEVDDGKGQ